MHSIAAPKDQLMYIPDAFREARTDVLHDAVRRIGFATLVTADLNANHLPMLLDAPAHGSAVLRGHVARANTVWKSGEGEVLAIFLGPQAYVSPSWYPSKAETGKAVPTWNYITVHARGRIRWVQEADWLRSHVTVLSQAHEDHRPEPWTIDEAPDSYIQSLLRAIVGFEIEIIQLDGKYKLTQNRDAADREAVAEAYAREGREDMARLMGKP